MGNPLLRNISVAIAGVMLATACERSTGPQSGSLSLTVSGLPSGVAAAITITGPDSKTLTATASHAFENLLPGSYTITAGNVSVGTDTYDPTTSTLQVEVTAGSSVDVSTSYVLRPATFNLDIPTVYLTQSIQNAAGSVPLVAGRDAYLRVFVRANETNSTSPQVRVRFYRSGQLVETQTISAPKAGVPTTVSEAATEDSWGIVVSGNTLQPGTSILADVDPANSVREVTESDNSFPASGNPLPLDIRTVASVSVRFVPIITGDGFTGNVTAARVPELLDLTLRMHPMSSMSADVRAPYTTSNVLVTNDTNNAWLNILSEIDAIRVAESSGRYYVGVMKNNGKSYWSGYGYIPGKSTIVLDGANASELVAHELGHNWGRLHTPCGSPLNPDPHYPYADGGIGVFGFDLAYGKILPPSVPDVMSYCFLSTGFSLSAPRQWISDYTYVGVMTYRNAHPSASVSSDQVQDCLIVWGRINGGEIIMEPAFTSRTVPSVTGTGRLHLKAIADDGSTMLSASFDPMKVADGSVSEEHFAIAIPLSASSIARLKSLRLSENGLEATVETAATPESVNPQVNLTRLNPDFVRLQWDASKNPLLVVRDKVTHEILSLARSGDMRIRTSKSIDVAASDRVRSRPANLQILQ